MSVHWPAVFAVDPPWPSPRITTGSALNHYPTMGIQSITAALVAATAAHKVCVLFLWRIAMFQEAAMQVCRDADFAVKDDLVWNKMTKHGKQHYGMGRYLKKSHETCIVASRGGQACLPVKGGYVRSSFSGAVREHSRKPEEFYMLVEKMYPNSPKFEMFSREARPGWTQVHSNEPTRFKK